MDLAFVFIVHARRRTMADLKDLFQTADWKREKHVPVIEVPDRIGKGEFIPVKVTVGKEIAHPNKTEHHIGRIDVYFLPNGEKFAIPIGGADFSAHGASTQGPDTSTVYTDCTIQLSFKTDKAGTIFASSLCNVHGLWLNSQVLTLGPAAGLPTRKL
jgi:superoxide reductase